MVFRALSLLVCMTLVQTVFCQSALLDIESTSQGVLLPRLATNDTLSIANPSEGMLFFNTNTGKFNHYTGTSWFPNIAPKGLRGDDGTQGLEGPPGDAATMDGGVGDPGAAGVMGPSGPQGPKGVTGPQGAQGNPGPGGVVGPPDIATFQVATATGCMVADHPLINSFSNALILHSNRRTSFGTTAPPTILTYDSGTQRWSICSTDGSNLKVGDYFDLLRLQ